MISIQTRRSLALIIDIVILVMIGIFVYTKLIGNNVLSTNIVPFILPLFGVLYLIKAKKKSFYFLMFVVLNTMGEIALLVVKRDPDLIFFSGISLFILSYMFLIIEVVEGLIGKKGAWGLLRKYRVYFSILLVIIIFLVWKLFDHLDLFLSKPEMMVSSFLYSFIIFILFFLSIINLLENYGKKSLWLFFASLFVILGEVVQLMHYYYVSVTYLSLVYYLLEIVSFYLFYKQAIYDTNILKN